jgi:hypothetical protein
MAGTVEACVCFARQYLVEASSNRQRAQRYGVTWPVRVRRVNETNWHAGRSVNLSVTGILLQMARRYHVGECLELEIEFLAHPELKTIIRGVGHVVREDRTFCGGAAIQFDVNGAPSF